MKCHEGRPELVARPPKPQPPPAPRAKHRPGLGGQNFGASSPAGQAGRQAPRAQMMVPEAMVWLRSTTTMPLRMK